MHLLQVKEKQVLAFGLVCKKTKQKTKPPNILEVQTVLQQV